MNPKILVRADGGAAMGAGHAARCLALAEESRRGGGVVDWAATELPDWLKPASEFIDLGDGNDALSSVLSASYVVEDIAEFLKWWESNSEFRFLGFHGCDLLAFAYLKRAQNYRILRSTCREKWD